MVGGGIKLCVWCNGEVNPQVLILSESKLFWHLALVWFSFGKRVQYYLSPAVIQISHLISKFFEKGKLHGTAQNLTQGSFSFRQVEIRTT